MVERVHIKDDNIYVRDGYITRPVLKPSQRGPDGFKSWSGRGPINSAERRPYSSAGLLCSAVGKSSSRHRLTAGRSGKIKLACVVFVAPPSFIALQRIAVRRIGPHRSLRGMTV